MSNYDNNEDDEDPDLISSYQGFFSNQRSADLILKICFTLLCFLIFILVTAWHITRKSYRLPRGPPKPPVSRISDIFSLDCRCSLACRQLRCDLGGIIGCNVRRHLVTVVNDAMIAEVHHRDSQLDSYFTCAPESFSNDWRGVLLTRSSHERKILRKLVLYVFEEMPIPIQRRAIFRLLYPVPDVKVTLEAAFFKQWAWRLTFDMLLSDETENLTETDSWELNQLSNDLYNQVVGLNCLHFGKCGVGAHYCKCSSLSPEILQSGGLNIFNLLNNIKQLLAPSVRYAMENFNENMEVNFVSQFIKTKLDFDDQGNCVNFLTVSHLCHTIAEVAFIVNDMLTNTLNWSLFLLAGNPKIQKLIRSEADQLNARCDLPGLSPEQLQKREINVWFTALHCPTHLVHSKAFVHEMLRLSCPQAPFDLRKVGRDGYIDAFDYCEGDLLLFNQISYQYDPDIWGYDANRFLPTEHFLDPSGSEFRPPEAWSRLFLGEYTVYLPGDYFANWLVLFISGLCSSYDIQPTPPHVSMELDLERSPGFARLPSDLPSYTFTPFNNSTQTHAQEE